MKKLLAQLKVAVVEKDVENAFRAMLARKLEVEISSPYLTDGYFETGEVRCLCEFKEDISMTNRKEYMPLIAQGVGYLKKFQSDGKPLPNVLFFGDRNECFIIPSGSLISYLSKPYDWSIAPSSMGKHISLIADLMKDEHIAPYPFKVDVNLNFDSLKDFITRLALGSKADVAITAKNLPEAYEFWRQEVIKVKTDENGNLLPPPSEEDIVEMFLTVLTKPQECYLHPKNLFSYIVKGKEFKIKGASTVKAFFSRYKETYDPEEIRIIMGSKDRLMQDMRRRKTGSFFTPSLIERDAHQIIDSHFPNWRNRRVVWDNTCGTCNLTRDYSFKELYCSTLDQSDLNTADVAGFNPEATKFQMDAFNDDETKLPEGLKKALTENRSIMFGPSNPPYATANTLEFSKGNTKVDVCSTKTNTEMLEAGMGACSQQLYAQDLYRKLMYVRKYNLTDAVVSIFSPPLWLSGESFSALRAEWLKTFEYVDGALYPASMFSDTSSAWGVSFTLWKTKA